MASRSRVRFGTAELGSWGEVVTRYLATRGGPTNAKRERPAQERYSETLGKNGQRTARHAAGRRLSALGGEVASPPPCVSDPRGRFTYVPSGSSTPWVIGAAALSDAPQRSEGDALEARHVVSGRWGVGNEPCVVGIAATSGRGPLRGRWRVAASRGGGSASPPQHWLPSSLDRHRSAAASAGAARIAAKWRLERLEAGPAPSLPSCPAIPRMREPASGSRHCALLGARSTIPAEWAVAWSSRPTPSAPPAEAGKKTPGQPKAANPDRP